MSGQVHNTGSLIDLAVVGSGAAGLMAACVAAEAGVPVTILTDRGLGTSNSAVAQGGLQFPNSTVESRNAFVSDILRSAGDGYSDRRRVDHFAEMVNPTVERLIEWGLAVDTNDEGELIRHRAGGFSEDRLITAGDRIGAEILRVLRTRLTNFSIEVRAKTSVVDLIQRKGVFELATSSGSTRARAVILAIGGATYQEAQRRGDPTSNPANHNKTLYGAVRALGVAEIEPTRYQYHPYGIVGHDGVPTGKCVPESITSLGARVVGVSGTPIVSSAADRRAVTAAMLSRTDDAIRISDGRAAYVLTTGEVHPSEINKRYPRLARVLQRYERQDGHVLITPVMHYQLGGFAVSPDCSTTVPGLFLAGEMTGGLHGANRLMGNGITEAIVDGATAASTATAYLNLGSFTNIGSGQKTS